MRHKVQGVRRTRKNKRMRKRERTTTRTTSHLGIEYLVLVKDHLHHLLVNPGEGAGSVELDATCLLLLQMIDKYRC